MPLSRVDTARYPELLAEKCAAVGHLLAPYSPPEAVVYPSAAEGFRMRAEFRIWHDGDDLNYVMFRPDDPATPVPVTHFPIACEGIRRLMPVLRSRLLAEPGLRRKLFQVEFLSTLAGDTLITLVYHRRLAGDWEAPARDLADALGVSVVGRSRRQKLVIGRDHVRESLQVAGRDFHYRQYEQSFTQPNALVNTRMLAWACERASGLDGDLLELYCGNGNFTLPLAMYFDRVIATELAKASVRAARENLAENGIDNVYVIRLSAEEVAEAMRGERTFRRLAELPAPLPAYDLRTVFVDPPRAGLDPATVALVSGFDSILYVSCNPYSLADNLAVLCATHDIAHFALFDQFPYTDHMECGLLLRRRQQTVK